MKLNIAHRINLDYMRSARLFAVPSLYGPFGIVALEAMASGIPVIAYDVGGLSEIIDDQKTGFKYKLVTLTDWRTTSNMCMKI